MLNQEDFVLRQHSQPQTNTFWVYHWILRNDRSVMTSTQACTKIIQIRSFKTSSSNPSSIWPLTSGPPCCHAIQSPELLDVSAVITCIVRCRLLIRTGGPRFRSCYPKVSILSIRLYTHHWNTLVRERLCAVLKPHGYISAVTNVQVSLPHPSHTEKERNVACD